MAHTFLEGGAAFNSMLFGHARRLVRAAAERAALEHVYGAGALLAEIDARR